MSKDQRSLALYENVIDSSRPAIAVGSLSVDASPNACPSQTQSVYNGGNGNMVGTWGTCLPDVNAEGLENSSYLALIPKEMATELGLNQVICLQWDLLEGEVIFQEIPKALSFCSKDMRFENSGLWSDWSKPGNGMGSLVHLSSSTAVPKTIVSLGFSPNHFGMASQQKESFYGFGAHLGPSYKSYPQGQTNPNSGYDVSSSMFGMNGQSWPTLHEAIQGRRCIDFLYSCNVALDTLGERNKGPRAFKPRSQMAPNGSLTDNYRNAVSDVYNESYNCLDFVTDYKDAKFFVIKSYSEDNVHKSIKYGVWASTLNGNKKLDTAYHEAKEKHGTIPVFLLFSVNASAQFCGVAEMVGPVDFDKSVDYWQQDKWSGQFSVKWCIIKDVPNSQFRHIALENNDNKPVTNSRDTQEIFQVTYGT
ncbi:hypothetical protein GH714_017300 [Hevea brasiliensis]|uniref:YTH domain-containing family protein n=1 Tax=Hevea brasiliensis TaxID=3981 RepID=A0A6A6KEC6_HEVBR|nr:hypothetical protein GH714_017300 [Hevea brasiliensis]